MDDKKKDLPSEDANDATRGHNDRTKAEGDSDGETVDFQVSSKPTSNEAPGSDVDADGLEATFLSPAAEAIDGTMDFDPDQLGDPSIQFDPSRLDDDGIKFDSDQGDDRTSLFVGGASAHGATADELAKRQSRGDKKIASAIGTKIGEYEVVSELGRGGMGVVYKARHQKLRRDVALKMILSGEHTGKEALDRFLLEARAVAHLQHPNIVQIFDIGEHNGLPYFSLEFVDGKPLNDVVDEEPLTSRAAATIVLTLAEAMQYAHDEGIVHRDIKPANILLAKDGTPKISDFGLAKEVDGDSGRTRVGQIMGTPSYMSPEQARGQNRELGPASDQYSLGALLYRLVAGRAPFAAAKPFETVMQVIKNDPVPPRQLQPNISVDLETICLKTLQKDPASRYENCTELANDLRRFLNGEPIAARPVSGLERFWRWCKRNPRIAIPSAAAIAMLVLATAISTWAYATVSQQNVVIEREKDNALEQEAIAKEQTKLAEEKTRVAIEQAENGLEIIQDTLTNVNDRLSTDPKLDDLRIDISKSLSKSLERIDPSVLENEQSEAIPTLMAIWDQMIQIFEKEGNYDDAMRVCQQVYEMAKRRVVVKVGNDASRMNLARIGMTYAGLIDKVERDSKKSEAMLKRSLDLVRDIINNPKPADDKDTTKAWDIQFTLGAVLQNLGANVYSQGDLERFNDYFTEALEVYENWQKMIVDDKDFNALPEAEQKRLRNNVAGNLRRMRMGLATYQLKDGKLEDSFENFDTIVADAKGKFESEDRSPLDRVNFQQILDMYGFNKLMVAIDSEERRDELLSEAERLLDESLEVSKDLVAEYDKSTDLKFHLSLVHYRRGILYEIKQDAENAEAQFKESHRLRLELQEASPSEKHSNMLMVAEARIGNWEVAKKMADEKAAADPDATQCVKIARAYVLCSQCEGAPKEELKALALEAIKKAIANEFSDSFELRHEPDLLSIQDDEKFKEMISKIPKKS